MPWAVILTVDDYMPVFNNLEKSHSIEPNVDRCYCMMTVTSPIVTAAIHKGLCDYWTVQCICASTHFLSHKFQFLHAILNDLFTAGAPGGDRVPLQGGVLCPLDGWLSPRVGLHRQPAQAVGPGRSRSPQPAPGVAAPERAHRCAQQYHSLFFLCHTRSLCVQGI